MNKNARILVVDDKESFRFMTKGYLSDAGYGVTCAGNAEEALQELAKISYDLLVTDIVMPEKEGIETIIDLQEEFPQVKIIAISGGGTMNTDVFLRITKDMTSKLNVEAFLYKPFSKEEMILAIEAALSK